MSGDLVARIRLARSAGIGPVTYRHLVGRFGSAAEAIEAIPALAARGRGRPPRIAGPDLAHAEIDRVEALGARFVCLGEPGYPALLAELADAPPLLIVRGDTGLAERPLVAIVGARNASAAACRFARTIAHDLGRRGSVVVSGLARGIDSAAHDGSLDSGTIAVIAGGIDIVYPPENAALQERIATEGLLIAEMPPGTEPRARHFPYRNRIIAGMAAGTLVVEAAPRSGSLITARLATEAGREVMAVPGSPLDARAQGCNQLIRDGATLVQNADEVLEAIEPLSARLRSPADLFDPAPAEDAEADAGETPAMSILSLLGPSPVPVDDVIRLSGGASGAVQMALLELDLAGRLDRHAGNRVSLRVA